MKVWEKSVRWHVSRLSGPLVDRLLTPHLLLRGARRCLFSHPFLNIVGIFVYRESTGTGKTTQNHKWSVLQKLIENRPIDVKLFQDMSIDIKQIEKTLSELKELLSFFESVERRNVWRLELGDLDLRQKVE